jgi:ferritin
MIGEKMQKAMNDQINAESYSAYLYWSVAAYFEDLNLPGFASWMKAQAQEEMLHASKFYDHITERGGRVKFAAIKEPPAEWDSPLAAFEAAYEHECYISGRINDLCDLADAEKDRPAGSMLRWFVDEQVEEEATVDEIVSKLKLLKDAPGALFMLDRELGSRTFSPAEDSAEGGE